MGHANTFRPLHVQHVSLWQPQPRGEWVALFRLGSGATETVRFRAPDELSAIQAADRLARLTDLACDALAMLDAQRWGRE